MKKILLTGIIGCTLLFAVDVTPYAALISYDKQTDKKNAYIAGVYFSNFYKQYKIENDIEYLDLSYNTTSDYKEYHWTFVVNYFKGYDYKYKLGIHNIFSRTPNTYTYSVGTRTYKKTEYNNNYDFVLFGGIMFYKYLKYNYGVDFYYSNHSSTDVYQITPYYGFNFGDYYSNIGSFYFQTKFNYINLSDNAAPKKNYFNFDIKLQNFKGAWITTLKASLGKTAYKVADNGFVVYNLGEEYSSVYSIDIGKKLSKRNFISFSAGISNFTESNGKDGSSTLFSVSYTHNY